LSSCFAISDNRFATPASASAGFAFLLPTTLPSSSLTSLVNSFFAARSLSCGVAPLAVSSCLAFLLASLASFAALALASFASHLACVLA
jgi:hypothetical protein